MSQTIDRAGLVNVYETLAAVKGSLKEVLHKWTAASLRKQLEPTVDPIIEQRTEVEKKRPVKFEEEREALCKLNAAKDDKGNPIVSGNQYLIDPALQTTFGAALDALKEKYKDDLDAWKKLVDETNAFLKEDIEFPETKSRLKLSWFAKTVDQQHLEDLMPLIDADMDVVEALAKAAEEAATAAAAKAADKK